MYELRILSGLHRGATLPLTDEPHTIGASDDADVVLVDEGIKVHHATLTKTDAGWLLTAGDGQLFGVDSSQKQSLIDLAPGEFARVGDVWIVIVPEDAHWVAPPPITVDEQFEPFGAAGPEVLAQEEDAADKAAMMSDVVPGEREPVVKSKWRGQRIILGTMAATVVLSAAAAYAMTTNSASTDVAKPRDTKSGALLGEPNLHGSPVHVAVEVKNPGSKKIEAPAAALNTEVLRNLFRKRLADADLLSHFEMALNDQVWQMQADLDAEETTRFDRILQVFLSENKMAIPVHAKIVSSEKMLPFKISQVISGTDANVVTQDGQRLYLGEEYRGFRVVAIQDNHLSFDGKRKIEMDW